jgi:hypothetical protein
MKTRPVCSGTGVGTEAGKVGKTTELRGRAVVGVRDNAERCKSGRSQEHGRMEEGEREEGTGGRPHPPPCPIDLGRPGVELVLALMQPRGQTRGVGAGAPVPRVGGQAQGSDGGLGGGHIVGSGQAGGGGAVRGAEASARGGTSGGRPGTLRPGTPRRVLALAHLAPRTAEAQG